MTYEVVSLQNGCAFGSVLRCGTFDYCCKYAKTFSKECGIPLLVRSKVSSNFFFNGREVRVH